MLAQFMIYKHSLLSHSVYNNQTPCKDWLDLNLNQNFNAREPNFHVFNCNLYNIGKNEISERLNLLNGKIPLVWLNQDKISFKIKCKQNFYPLLSSPSCNASLAHRAILLCLNAYITILRLYAFVSFKNSNFKIYAMKCSFL